MAECHDAADLGLGPPACAGILPTIRHNVPMPSEHKHAGSRKGAARPPTFRPLVLVLAAAVTFSVVSWGYLVYLAIDFGTSARGGDTRAWWFLAMASLGAVFCLFLGLVLIARLMRALGLASPPAERPQPPPPRTPGGRRAAR